MRTHSTRRPKCSQSHVKLTYIILYDKWALSDGYREWLLSYSTFFTAEGLQSPEAGIRDRRQE